MLPVSVHGLKDFESVIPKQFFTFMFRCEEAHKSKKLIRRKKKVKNISGNLI